MDTLRLLLIDDDEDDYILTSELLHEIESFQFEIDWTASVAAARQRLAEHSYDLCLLDYRLGGDDGLDFLPKLIAAPTLRGPVIMLTGQDDHRLDTRAMERGAADYLTKAELDTAKLDRAIRYALMRQQAAQERLERLKAEAENHSKSEFLAHISHELRTPLTAVLGYAELLSAELIDAQHREYAQIIQRNGRHLLNLLNDILDLSKIAAGKLELDRQQVMLTELVTEVESLMTVQAAAKNLAFSIAYDGQVPAVILTDPTRLRQILINLLGNAIKFTDQGSVELRVALQTASADSPTQLRFEISDSGPGISAADQERLFEPFVQGQRPGVQTVGSGLGLAISRQLAQLLDGTLSVVSHPDTGSTFTLTIGIGDLQQADWIVPSNRPASPSQNWQASPRLQGRVLVVDDLPDIRRLLAAILQRAGATVELAADGEQALARVAQVSTATGQTGATQASSYDVIVLDMQMPRLDGYKTTQRLRAGGYDGVIIALTAAAMRGERERCLQAGCDEYLSKPIRPALLLERIAKHLPSERTSPVVASKALHILLVDDNDDARNATARLLTTLGHHVYGSANGEAALQQVATMAPVAPDAVLLDISLPDIDGYQLAAQLRTQPTLERTTFIALSGHDEDRERLTQAGFNHYLSKPASLADIVALLPS